MLAATEEVKMKEESWGLAWVWAEWRMLWVEAMVGAIMVLVLFGDEDAVRTGNERWIIASTPDFPKIGKYQRKNQSLENPEDRKIQGV